MAARKKQTRTTPKSSLPISAPSAPTGSGGKCVLIAVTGMSPAVLTETVWALAHEPQPVIPDEIYTITTTGGRDAIQRQLFSTDQIWQQLRCSLLGSSCDSDQRLTFSADAPNTIVASQKAGGTRQFLDRIDSEKQNFALADTILDELWKHTAKPDRGPIVISIAGGYKSMSALMMACFSLLGDTCDRITHVLVGAPYDHPKLGFYFPKQKKGVLTLDAATYSAEDADITLFDIPWVPFGKLFEKNLRNKPASYSDLVTRLRSQLPIDPVRPDYRWDEQRHCGVITCGESIYEVHGKPAALFVFLLARAEAGQPPICSHKDAVEPLDAFLATAYPGETRINWKSVCEAGEITKNLSKLRQVVPDLVSAGRGSVGLVWREGMSNL